jgi:hypothetical protein
MPEQAFPHAAAHTISEAEFIKLCDDLYNDRQRIYQFNPSAGKRDALLWMLLGCLMSLLSVAAPPDEGGADGSPVSDAYADAVKAILRGHMRPPFDPQVHLAELSRKLDSE